MYQPLESLYLVRCPEHARPLASLPHPPTPLTPAATQLLITNKSSNIMEDLETLRLLSKIVPEYTEGSQVDEDSISESCFELICAFDEVISLGHKENISMQQVKTYIDMESNEEKLAKMIRQNKINEAREEAKRKQKMIDEQRRGGGGKYSGGGGMGGGGGGGVGGVGSGGHLETPVLSKTEPSAKPAAKHGPRQKRGMKLGGKSSGTGGKTTDDYMQAMRAEGEIFETGGGGGQAAVAVAAAASGEPVQLAIRETISANLNKDGGLEHMDVKGEVSLRVLDPAFANLSIDVECGENDGFQFKTHPNINKQQYAQSNVLELKDPQRPFPVNSDLGVLKWRMQSKDEGALPLSINCWPSVSGDLTYVNIEYELVQEHFVLSDVVITIPLPTCDGIEVPQIDGEYKLDRRAESLEWRIDMIETSNNTGSLEFTAPASAAETFFPVSVSFSSSVNFIDLSVNSVSHALDGSSVRYSEARILEVDSYTVE